MSIKHARNRAEALIDSLGIKKYPVDVVEIAKQLGIPVVEMNLGADVSGLLVTNPDSSSIAVQKTDSLPRRRFTIAHEIGHFYLRHQFEPGEHVHVDRGNYISQRSLRSSEGIDPKEVEANQFAACLLMPSKLLYDRIGELNTVQLFDSHVSQLAKDFDVSEQAMTIRLSALGCL